MAQGVPGTCELCDAPEEVRLEINCRLLRGDSYEIVGDYANVSFMMPKRHLEAGHVQVEPRVYREWSKKHGANMPARLVASELEKIDDSPALTQDDITKRLLLLERYCHNVLARVEAAARRGDGSMDRTAILGLESARRLVMDIATVTGNRAPDPAKTIEASADVQALREQIEEAYNQKQLGR